MSKELITKKDYQILGVKENATSKEINVAYEKLLQEYHPEKIKLEKFREPNDLEVKKYHDIEKVYKKFDLEFKLEPAKYICCGWKGDEPCTNMFYPALWEKVENGRRKLYCSRECYSSKYENPNEKKLEEWNRQKLERARKHLEENKTRKINYIKGELDRNKVKLKELEPNNQDFEQEINSVDIKNIDDLDDYIVRLYNISDRIEKDIYSKRKKEEKKKEKCDICGKEIERYEEKPGMIVSKGVFSVDSDGNHHKYCSKECSEKGSKNYPVVFNRNLFAEFLKWMKREGITNFHLDPETEKLTIEFNNNSQKTLEDNNLSAEQKEIKKFLKQNKLNSLNQKEVEGMIDKGNLGGNKNKGNGLTIIIVVVVIIALIIGVVAGIIFQKRKKW